jgi:nucleoside-diphosphate-sugar epimerase
VQGRVLVLGGSGFIGTNICHELYERKIDFVNGDINPPLDITKLKYWIRCDILDIEQLRDTICEVRPYYIIDLVARTDVNNNEPAESGYSLNFKGVANLIAVLVDFNFVKRVIFTSTQYVKGPDSDFRAVMDYAPHTTYGQSKVMMEKAIFTSKIEFEWAIVRPTNVWGPWHYRYKEQFFKVLKKGLYFHPGGRQPVKSYAYVGNVADQICKLLFVDLENIGRKIFYVGDKPDSILTWVNGMSLAFTNRKVRVVPRVIFGIFVLAGDALSFFMGRPFLINSSRYKSLIEDYYTDMDFTFQILGENKYTISEGIIRTLEWVEAAESRH